MKLPIRNFFLLLLILPFLSSCGNRKTTTDFIVQKPKIEIPRKQLETVVIDPGHGGKDSGAKSDRLHYIEKELTLTTALNIRNYLQQLGYHVVLTRNQDGYIPLSTRAEMANNLNADLFVSVHYNYSTSEKAQGIEVYYYKEDKTPSSTRIVESKKLCSEILARVLNHTGAQSRGVKQANFAVIRETKMPAVLVEGGFLSNPSEREKLLDSQYVRYLAWGIAKGIDHYLEEKRIKK